MNRTFPISVVVTTVQGRILGCDESEYREFLNYMAGNIIPQWQVPQVRALVADYLSRNVKGIRSLPDMPEKTDSGNGSRHVKACAKHLGLKEITLRPLGQPIHAITLADYLEKL